MKTSLRRLGVLGSVLAAMAAGARADLITPVRGPVYSDSRIIRVEGGAVVFRLLGTTVRSMPISRIRTIEVPGLDNFNQAEKLLSAEPPQPRQALGLYGTVQPMASRPWLETLVRYRRIQALDQLARIDEAVKEWLAAMDAEGGAVDALRPTNLPDKGSPANRQAIEILQTKLQQIRNKPDYRQAAGRVLMELYLREGMSAKADALAEQVAIEGGPGSARRPETPARGGEAARKPSGNAAAATPPAPARADLPLQALQRLIRPGQDGQTLRKAIGKLETARRSADDTQLPLVLLLTGKAQLLVALSSRDERGAMLRQAGLNLMRVFAHYPDAMEAPEALYLAAKVNVELGNLRAARAAYQAVVNRYSRSKIAPLAQQALRALRGRGE